MSNLLIYELFSGVGLCNQLFSLETAVYLANIMNRKLILIIINPLAHCGKATWDYGYLLNFFESDYLRFLPNGLEVYYKTIPENIQKYIKESYKFDEHVERFSHVVFVDKELDTPQKKTNIEAFCHYRNKVILDLELYKQHKYVYIKKCNASRCFYNFYTTITNYNLMYNISLSFRFKQVYYDLADKIYNNLNRNKNSLFIFSHLRFGDYHKGSNFIERSNTEMIQNLTEYYDSHKTNMITPTIFFLIDNKNNPKFLNAMKKYNYIFIEDKVNSIYDNHMKENVMTFQNVNSVKNSNVVNAIIEMILSVKADDFIGYLSSTFSHYINYLRYTQGKSFYNYSNLNYKNTRYCRLQQVQNSTIEWIRLGFSGGHPISWHYFFDPFPQLKRNMYFTSEGKSDGFGSQLQACFSLIAYCAYKNYTYIHRPFSTMHHNDEKLNNFPKLMNDFVNLEHKFKSINNISNFESSQLFKFKEGYMVHGSLHPEFFYNDSVLNEIRSCYYSSPKPNIDHIYSNNNYNIALHIRRGDVSKSVNVQRYTPNDRYIEILKNQKLPENTMLHIFSEGSREDFEDIIKVYPNILLHLNTNIQVTFHCLVKSDMLILSKSSFSYSAALLNENTVNATIIKTWWHKPLKHWVIS
jgi:hypothetical protein